MDHLPLLLIKARQMGFRVSGGELWRNKEIQKIYFDSGRSSTMNSRHWKKLALDINFFLDGKVIDDYDSLLPIGEFWESLHEKNVWGGRWKNPYDPSHFETNL